jgi:tetratricopeptide (TPR) repeat protein
MDANNPVIKLCIAGTQAEFAGRLEAACELYRQAWEASADDYEACITAHYMARCQATPEETLRWNQVALERADAVNDDRVRDFYPSLYLNMGRSYELLGDQDEAAKYYALAAELGVTHQME